jgi:hypothetical protein
MKYDVVGVNGNAYSVMGYVAKAMRESGKTREEEEVDAYYADAKSGDYGRLLAVSVAMIDRLNEESGEDGWDE